MRACAIRSLRLLLVKFRSDVSHRFPDFCRRSFGRNANKQVCIFWLRFVPRLHFHSQSLISWSHKRLLPQQIDSVKSPWLFFFGFFNLFQCNFELVHVERSIFLLPDSFWETLVIDQQFRLYLFQCQLFLAWHFKHEQVRKEIFCVCLEHPRSEPNVFYAFQLHVWRKRGRQLNHFPFPIFGCYDPLGNGIRVFFPGQSPTSVRT